MENRERRVPVESLGVPRFRSPLRLTAEAGKGFGRFVPEETWVRQQVEVSPGEPETPELFFEKAGPRERIFFDPARTRAAIVTCGGLCPGLNNVIRSIYLELTCNYGLTEVLGIRNGYLGLNPAAGPAPMRLRREDVSGIQREGGTVLGSSRGNQDPKVMVDFLAKEKIDLLFTIGGDGTQRGAHAIHQEVKRRGLPIAVVGIPKTIDNDLLYCDRTFGFFTAVELARNVVYLARNEARGTVRGIGLVKVMGRDAGFIACGAALASQEVDFALIPEVPFRMEGEEGLLRSLEKRLEAAGHAVVVVAEGAGQHLFDREKAEKDPSGNPRYQDIGPFLKEEVLRHFRSLGKPVDIKYIDPSYIIRSVPANCDDSILCDMLARKAAHAAMAGKTDVLIGFIHMSFIHVPIPMAIDGKRRMDLEGPAWAAVLAATGQPATFRERIP